MSNVKSVFPVLKLPLAHESGTIPAKVGELEVEVRCVYDPTLKLQTRRMEVKRTAEGGSKEAPPRPQVAHPPERRSDRGANDSVGQKRDGDGASESKVDQLINQAELLRKKMIIAEQNAGLGEKQKLREDLYDGGYHLLSEPDPSHGRNAQLPNSKEAELARFKLQMDSLDFDHDLRGPNDRHQSVEDVIEQKFELELSDIDKLKLTIHSLQIQHPTFSLSMGEDVTASLLIKFPKFKPEAVKSESATKEQPVAVSTDLLTFFCQMPPKSSSASDPKRIANKLAARTQVAAPIILRIDKEAKLLYKALDVGVSRLAAGKLEFVLSLKVPIPGKSGSGQPHYTKANVALGALSFDTVLNSPQFKSENKVLMTSLLPLQGSRGKTLTDLIAAAGKAAENRTASKKQKPDPKAPEIGEPVCILQIDAEFISDRILVIPRPPTRKVETPTAEFTGTNHLKETLNSRLSVETRLLEAPLGSTLPVCLFLHILRASKVPNRSDSSQRNVFVQHKVYPTPDDVVSQVFWNQSNPEFDHRITIPLTNSTLRCTKELPLTIGLWDRRSPTLSVVASPGIDPHIPSKGDQIIGVVHLSLQPVFGLLGSMSPEQISATLASQELSVMELSKKYHPIEHLVPPADYKASRDANTLGFLKIMLAVGNVRQITEYNSKNPGNNSQMLGLERVSTGLLATGDWEELFPQEVVPKVRDPSLKTALVLTGDQLTVLETQPALRHAVKVLIDALNSGNTSVEKFSADMRVLMTKQTDPTTAEVLKDVDREAHRCNPFSYVDYSRKNYLRLGDKQLVFDKTERKYFQIFGEGEKSPMDKCEFLRRDGTKELVFVDPTVLKCPRREGGERILTPKMCAILKKYGRTYKYLVVEMKEQLEKEKMYRREERKLKKEIEERAEELERRKLQMAIDEVQRKAKEKELLEIEWKKRQDAIDAIAKQKIQPEAPQPSTANPQPPGDGPKEKPTGSQSYQNSQVAQPVVNSKVGTLALKGAVQVEEPSAKGWKALKSKLSTITKEVPREDDSYLDKSSKDIGSVVMVSPRKKAGFAFKSESGPEPSLHLQQEANPAMHNLPESLNNSKLTSSKNSLLRGLREAPPPKSRFEVIKVGMVLGVATMQGAHNRSTSSRDDADWQDGNHISRSPRPHETNRLQFSNRYQSLRRSEYSSSDSSDEQVRLRNLNMLGEDDENYDTTVVVKQYDTELVPGFESQDLMQNFTMLLEYMRRTLQADEKMKKNLKFLLLGLYQSHNHKDINMEDFESIMESYAVPMSRREVLPIFRFLDFKQEGAMDMSLLHDALVGFASLYRTYHSQYEGTFKYILDKVETEPSGLQKLETFLINNSENYHIDSQMLEEYLQVEFMIPDINLVSAQLEEYCGFLYFDKVYIINLLNIVFFLQKSQQTRVSPQKVNSFHTYDSFVPLVLQKIRESLSKSSETADQTLEIINRELMSIEREIGEGARKRSTTNSPVLSRKNTLMDIEYTASLNFMQFRELLSTLELGTLTIYESMLLFSFARSVSQRKRQVISHEQTVSLTDIQVLFFIVVSDGTLEEVESLYGREITGTLAQFVNREKLFATKEIAGNGKLVLPKKKKNLLLTRRKMRNEPVQTDRILYRVTVNLQAVESLNLPIHLEYCELSLSFCFPGEEEPFESQIFTYIPREQAYEVLLNTEHTYRCPESVDISEIFAEAKLVRIRLNQVKRSSSTEIANALVPFNDIVAMHPSTRQYFLFPSSVSAQRTDAVSDRANHLQPFGTVRLAFAFHVSAETLSQKDFFFSKRYLLNNNSIEKDSIFERDVPISGSLLITAKRVHSFQGLYNLLEVAKKHCMFGKHDGKVMVSLVLRVKELQKDQRVHEEDPEKSRPELAIYDQAQMQGGFNSYLGEYEKPYLFKDFAIDLKHAHVGSSESLFTFLDSIVSHKGIGLYSVHKEDLHLDPFKMGLVSSSDIEFGLYLNFSGPVPHREEKICSSTIECSNFLSLQNLGGVNRTLQLKSPKLMEPMALMEVNLNFTKVHLEDAYLSNLAKFKDIEAIIDRVRSRELTVQLSHLLVLRSDCCRSAQSSHETSGRFSFEETAQQMSAASCGPKVYFLMVRIGTMCLESTLAIDPTESEEFKLSETAHPVLRIKLSQKKHKSVLVVNFKGFLADQTLEVLFQKYMGCTDDVPNLVEFVISHLPDLEIFIKEVPVQSHDTEAFISGQMTVSLESIFRSSFDPAVASFPLVGFSKAYLPFESTPGQKPAFNVPSKLKLALSSQKQPVYVSQKVAAASESTVTRNKTLRMMRVRLSLKLFLINTKGSLMGTSQHSSLSLSNQSAIVPAPGSPAFKETLEMFTKIIDLDWLKDSEIFATKVREFREESAARISTLSGVDLGQHSGTLEGFISSPPPTSLEAISPPPSRFKQPASILDICEQGLTVHSQLLSQLLMKELQISLLQASVLTAMLGQSQMQPGHANLFYLVCYPLDPATPLVAADVPEVLISEVLTEFIHHDQDCSGLIDYGEAFKLVMGYTNRFSLSVRQIQAFKYRDFMRDVRDSLEQQTLRSLEAKGFDYLQFLHEVQSAVNRWQANRSERHRAGYSVASLEKELNQIKNLHELVPPTSEIPAQIPFPLRSRLETHKARPDGNSSSLLRDSPSNRYILYCLVQEGRSLEQLTEEPVPNTFVKVLLHTEHPLESTQNLDIAGPLVRRDKDPEWHLKASVEFRGLESLLRSDPQFAFHVTVYEHKTKANLAQGNRGSITEDRAVGRCVLKLFEVFSESELCGFLQDPQEDTYEKTFILDCAKINTTKEATQGKAKLVLAMKLVKDPHNLTQQYLFASLDRFEIEQQDQLMGKILQDDALDHLRETLTEMKNLHHAEQRWVTSSKGLQPSLSDLADSSAHPGLPTGLDHAQANLDTALNNIQEALERLGVSQSQSELDIDEKLIEYKVDLSPNIVNGRQSLPGDEKSEEFNSRQSFGGTLNQAYQQGLSNSRYGSDVNILPYHPAPSLRAEPTAKFGDIVSTHEIEVFESDMGTPHKTRNIVKRNSLSISSKKPEMMGSPQGFKSPQINLVGLSDASLLAKISERSKESHAPGGGSAAGDSARQGPTLEPNSSSGLQLGARPWAAAIREDPQAEHSESPAAGPRVSSFSEQLQSGGPSGMQSLTFNNLDNAFP